MEGGLIVGNSRLDGVLLVCAEFGDASWVSQSYFPMLMLYSYDVLPSLVELVIVNLA